MIFVFAQVTLWLFCCPVKSVGLEQRPRPLCHAKFHVDQQQYLPWEEPCFMINPTVDSISVLGTHICLPEVISPNLLDQAAAHCQLLISGCVYVLSLLLLRVSVKYNGCNGYSAWILCDCHALDQIKCHSFLPVQHISNWWRHCFGPYLIHRNKEA